MAVCFESFGLSELVARPEDAFRLATLASVEGQRIPGYGGEYCRDRLGDAIVNVRLRQDAATGESELLGMDTHGASDCLWRCQAVDDLSPASYDGLNRRLLVTGEAGALAVVEVVNADVLPDCRPGTDLELNMAGFPREITYLPAGGAEERLQAEEGVVLERGGLFPWGYAGENVPEEKQNLVRLFGVVKDVRVGETFMGLEPMTTFVRATVETALGDVELCHTAELVAREQKDLVRAGSLVSALCVLSGDAAAGAYAGGIVYDEAHDLLALRRFFERGNAERLRPILHGECRYTSDRAQGEVRGAEEVIALLKDVEAALTEESCYFAWPAHLTESGEGLPYGRGKACLALAQGGPERFVALCFLEPDSLGRIRGIHLSADGRYSFDIDRE